MISIVTLINTKETTMTDANEDAVNFTPSIPHGKAGTLLVGTKDGAVEWEQTLDEVVRLSDNPTSKTAIAVATDGISRTHDGVVIAIASKKEIALTDDTQIMIANTEDASEDYPSS